MLDMDETSLRRQIGIVPQKAVLFKGTIRSNLLWGNGEASDEELMRAVELAQASEVVDMKGGLDGEVEQGGRNFSGGQRQRVGIARALAVNPRFIVCDEPISALDVSVQAQVVNLLKKLQKEKNLSYLFIAHDLSLVKYLSDRIGVMYMGSLVEVAEAEELYRNPLHPYTRALLSAIPVADPKEENERQRIVLQGEPSNPINTLAQCKFYSRCPHRAECCKAGLPALREVKSGHFLACSNADALYVDNQGFL